MALAGPAANFALVLLAGLAVRAGILIGVFQSPESVNFGRIVDADDGQERSTR